MLLTPADKPFDYRHPPRLSLGLAALLLILFAWLQPIDSARDKVAVDFYRQHLLAVEWPLYPTHLMQTLQADTLQELQTAYDHQDNDILARQLGFDRDFYQSIASKGGDYLEPDVLSQWREDRRQYNEQRDHISSQVLGLDSQRFRPITFFTHAFVDSNSLNVLAAVIILVVFGMAVEQAMGSGVVLCAWLVGSAGAGLGHLILHHQSVIPLIGSMGGVSGVLGVAFMHFRQAHSLRIWHSQHTLSGWLILLLFLGLTAFQFIRSSDSGPVLSAALAFVGGILVSLGYKRWQSVATSTEANDIDIIQDEMPADELYRHELHHALNRISLMQFSAAEKQLRELAEKYPHDKRILEHLYHLVKFRPAELEFEEISSGLFSLPNQPGANHLVLSIYNDYKKRSKTFVALDDDTSLKLAMRFARINAFKEAEESFKRCLDAKKPSPLLRKAAQALSQAFAAQQQEQRSRYYQQIAERELNQTRA